MGINVEKKDKTRAVHFPIVSIDGLDIKILGDSINRANTSFEIPSASLLLTGSDVNYVFIDWTTKTIQVSQAGFPSKSYQLYEITTDATEIAEGGLVDKRAVLRQAAHTEYQTKTSWLFSGSENSETEWIDKDLSGDVPEGATGAFLRIGVTDSGIPGVDVWCGIRKPGEIESSQNIKIFPQVSGIWTGAIAPIGLDGSYVFQMKFKPSGTMSYVVALVGWIFGGN